MTEKKVLYLKIRRRIYNHILKSPGLYERELARELNLPLSTLDYHLHHLKKRKLVLASSDGRYTRYYITGKMGVKDKKTLALLRQKVPRKIVLFLLLRSDSSHGEICNHLGVAPSTTSFHLNKLADLDVIERVQTGRGTTFHVGEPEYISDLLITYRKSFLDKSVDEFIGTWLELNPRHLHKTKKKSKKRDNKNIKLLLFPF